MKTLITIGLLMLTGCSHNPYAWDPLLNGAMIQQQRKIAEVRPYKETHYYEYSTLGTPTGRTWRGVTK